jgi:hypothetical protein
MKTSTLLTMVTLSASCFAAPVHTAHDALTDIAAQRINAAPVAPPAPEVAAQSDIRPDRWQHITLPKSRHLERGFATRDEHLQT